jgi:hypothetical protein
VDAWYQAGGYHRSRRLRRTTAPGRRSPTPARARGPGRLPAAVRGRGADSLRSPIFRAGPSIPRPPPSSRHAWRSGLRAPSQRGVTIFEGSRVRRPGRRARASRQAPIRARPRVRRRARGWSGAGRPPATRRRLTVASSHMVITEPVPTWSPSWVGRAARDHRLAGDDPLLRTTRTDASPSVGGGRIAPGAASTAGSSLTPGDRQRRAPPRPLLPGACRKANRARLGRADRRPRPICPWWAASRGPRPLRVRLHR